MKAGGKTVFEKYLKSGRIHPCILLVGPDKETKWQAALQLAKSVFCSDRKAGLFCGACSSCKRIDKGIFPDLLTFREDSEEALKVENVRDIIYQMEVAPLEGKAKVCCIEEAHRMNASSSNAFLKTLEEPKENRYFVLTTTKPGALLPTLISRSLLFHFKPEAEAVVFSREESQHWETLLQKFQKNADPEPILETCDEKEACLRFLQFIQLQLRQRAIEDINEGVFKGLSPVECVYKYQKIIELEGRLQSNANHSLLLESLMRREFIL